MPCGGNIGVPLIGEIEQIPEDEPIVLELSSFQLELLNQSPHGALVTNISENHLDVHLSMESYIQAKSRSTSIRRLRTWPYSTMTIP